MGTDPVEIERERCLRCVESNLPYAQSLDAGREASALGAESLLLRIANQIRGGVEPLTMQEQMEPE